MFDALHIFGGLAVSISLFRLPLHTCVTSYLMECLLPKFIYLTYFSYDFVFYRVSLLYSNTCANDISYNASSYEHCFIICKLNLFCMYIFSSNVMNCIPLFTIILCVYLYIFVYICIDLYWFVYICIDCLYFVFTIFMYGGNKSWMNERYSNMLPV